MSAEGSKAYSIHLSSSVTPVSDFIVKITPKNPDFSVFCRYEWEYNGAQSDLQLDFLSNIFSPPGC